jgi:hypothetical protein
MTALDEGNVFEAIMAKKTAQEWKEAESNWGLGYNRHSLHRKQHQQTLGNAIAP